MTNQPMENVGTVADEPNRTGKEKTMKIAVWIASFLLTFAFLVVGGSKLLASAGELQQMSEGVPVALLKLAGAAEVLGAIGLVVPAATRIMPVLTPIAATGLVITMVGATITNIAIGEPTSAALPIVLGTFAALVAWARFGRVAVEPRGSSLGSAHRSSRAAKLAAPGGRHDDMRRI
jgi:uncharacterized membrane protein YphA (DoxX/SURF4 family)